jgi:hypothetical protein
MVFRLDVRYNLGWQSLIADEIEGTTRDGAYEDKRKQGNGE